MRNRESIIGKTFGRLKVISEEAINLNGKLVFQLVCRCECGSEVIRPKSYITSGDTKSCGCIRGTHGHCRDYSVSRTYRKWIDMKSRVKPNSNYSTDYSDRGITIQWAQSYEEFFKDMGECPKGLTLDRIDNNLGYFPGNCRWATQAEQLRNNRRTHMIKVFGFIGCLTDAAIHFGIDRQVVYTRLRRGWNIEDAFKVPVKSKTS